MLSEILFNYQSVQFENNERIYFICIEGEKNLLKNGAWEFPLTFVKITREDFNKYTTVGVFKDYIPFGKDRKYKIPVVKKKKNVTNSKKRQNLSPF